ncbi:hypothetical protein HDR63_00365 [bacterium]|nr:hypothetical protein [bacterium]
MAKAKTVRARRVSENPVMDYVRRLYNRSSMFLLGEGILFAILGVVMLFRPVQILGALTVVTGVILGLFGLYRVIVGLAGDGRPGSSRGLDIVFGLLNILIGVLFCVYPVGAMIGLVYVFAILFLAKAIQALVFAIHMARARFGHYVMDLILAIVLVAAAILILVFPVVGLVTMMYYLAFTLILYAAANVYMYLELVKLKNLAQSMDAE